MQSKQEIDRLNQLLQEREEELEALRASSRDLSMMMAMQMSGLAWWKWDVSRDTVNIHGLPDVFPNSHDGDFQISGQEWPLLVEAVDVAEFNESLKRFHALGSNVWAHECRIRRLDGKRRWVEIRGYFCDETDCGEQGCLVGTIQDIDERKRNELHQSLQKEYLIEGSRVAALGTWVYQPESGVSDWSDGVFEIYGLTPGDVPSVEDSLAFFTETDRPRIGDAFAALERSGEGYDLECELVADGGIHKFVRVIGKRRYLGNSLQPYLVGVIQDVSEQHTMRRALDAFFELNPDLIGVIDFKQRPVKLCPSWEVLSGWSQHEMIRLGLECIIHDEDREKFAAAIRRTIDSNQKENLECRMVSKSGGVYWISWRMFADSSLELVFVSARDESDSRRVQEALLAAKDQADAASRAKSNILAAVSHELRTPLNPIVGFSDLLLEEVESEEHLEMLRSISSAGEHLTNIVDEILDFAKVDSGGETLVDDTFRVSLLLQACIKKMTSQLDLVATQIELKLTESSNVAPGSKFVGDQAKIERVLCHLVENAVKFSDKPKVTVDSELIALSQGSFLWHVDIHDNGIGIDPESLENIFEPFHQVDHSYARRRGGMGMGLAVCKRYVELMGGRLAVRSELGQGSTFSFFLPLRMAEPTVSMAAANVQECAALFEGKLKIFMVEDNESNVYYQSRILEELGCDLTSVTSGELAMAEYVPERYDCVLLDLHMPGLSGVEVLKWIRAEEARAGVEQVPIIILSVDIMPSARSHCIELGADLFVSKPVNPERLQQAIYKVLCKRPSSQ